jgi:uncharacterized membrane protein
MAFCSTCGAQIADGTTTCAACASRSAGFTPVQTAAPVAAAGAPVASGTDNTNGMLAYITIIPAIIFLVAEPYNKSRFVRFHAWQNILLHAAAFVFWIGLFIISFVLAFIPILGHLMAFLLWAALMVGFFVAWIIALLKANGGQMYKLPFIGDIAEKQANAM